LNKVSHVAQNEKENVDKYFLRDQNTGQETPADTNMSAEDEKKHVSKLHQLGLTSRRDNSCAIFSHSSHACQKAGCTYRPSGYITPALCYNPEKEVPGVLWGTWQRATPQSTIEEQMEEEEETAADKEVAESLETLQPFSSVAQYDQARAKRSKASPIDFTPRQ